MARVLTFMFTDVVGSTEILARLGEVRAETVRRAYFGLLRQTTATHGGRELKRLGDGVMASFESPSDAVACAVAIQRALARRNARAGERLDVRLGLQVGEATDGDEHYGRDDHVGSPGVVARLLCEAALGGQILASSLVQMLAATHATVTFEPVGLLELRGLPEPVAAFEVVHEPSLGEPPPLPPELLAPEVRRSEFVGRRAERERLLRLWSRAEQGGRELAFVSGEPGIGKSRLAAELAREAHTAGGIVLWGRCFEEALVPYQPFVQALRHYVTTCDPLELRGLSPQIAPLARLLPELAATTGGGPAPGEPEPEAERYRLFEAMNALLARISEDAPLLLVLDDLQWADDGTLLLLRVLAGDARPASILVLGTYRDSEVPTRHPLSQLRADVGRDRVVESIELDGLSGAEAAELVDSLLGWTLPSQVAETLRAETDGNPFFLEEVARHLEELGVSERDGGRVTAAALGVPRRVKELVGRRVRRLPATTGDALRVASVIGSEFRLDLLARVLGRREAELVAELDAAVEAKLLVEVPGRIGEYGFTHALVQQALYEEQTTNRRASLHGRVAEALEALRPEAAAALALHFSLAGDQARRKVVQHSRAAGLQALELLAYEDAAHEFERALGALALAGDGGAAEYAELLVLSGAAASRAGKAAEAEAAFAEAAELALRSGAATTLARAALGYGGGTGFGGVWTKFARVDHVLVRFLEAALVALPPEEARLRARTLGRLAEALYWADDAERARALALSEQALGLARELDDPVALAYALDSRHVALWQPEYLEELMPLAEEMLQTGLQVGDREIQLQAYSWLITDALERAPIAVADRYVAGHARVAQELGQPYHLWYGEVVRAMRAHLDGRFDQMAQALEAAWSHGQTAHGETAQAVHAIQLLHLQLATGGAAGEVVGRLEENAAASPLPAARAVLALAYAAAGRRDEALEQVAFFAGDEFPVVRRDCVWSSTICFLSDVVARLGVAEYAPPLHRLLLPFAERNCVVGGAILVLGPISLYLGMLACVEGDHERALRHLRYAHARARTLGSAPVAARTQLETARVLLARAGEGDGERAQGLLADVRATALGLGMEPLASEASAVAAASPHRAVAV